MKQILVLERALLARMRLKEALSSAEVRLIEVETEAEAVFSLQKYKNTIDLMIVEVIGDRGNDFDVIRRAKSLDHDLPVVILTSSNRRADFIKGIQAGASDYILKPFEDESFQMRIFNLMRHRKEAVSTQEVQAPVSGPVEVAPVAGPHLGASVRESFIELLAEEKYRATKGKYPITVFALVFHEENDENYSLDDEDAMTAKSKKDLKYLEMSSRYFEDVKAQLWASDELVQINPQSYFGILPFCGSEGFDRFKEKMLIYLNEDSVNKEAYSQFHWHVVGLTLSGELHAPMAAIEIIDLLKFEIEADLKKKEV